MSRGRLPTTVGQTSCPCFASSFTRLRRLHRVLSRCGRDQTFEIVQKSWILERLLLAPTAALADTSGRGHHMIAKVSKSVINRRSRQPGNPRHQTDAATPQRLGFQGDKAPTALFVEDRCHLAISLACRSRLRSSNHAAIERFPRVNPLQAILHTL